MEKLPNTGSIAYPKSEALLICKSEIAEAVIITDIEITPPNDTANKVSVFTKSKSDGESHLSLTNEACKKMLYGTTVVPISPTITIKLSAGNLGINNPFARINRSGLTIMAEVKKAKLINKTKPIRTFSIIFLFPINNIINAIIPTTSEYKFILKPAREKENSPNTELIPITPPLILPAS